MNKKLPIILIGAIIVIFLLCVIDLHSIQNQYVKNLWNNLKLISSAILLIIPLLILFACLYLLLSRKWALRVEKLSIGGFDVLFDNPTRLFRKQVCSFLDTKRTIFNIDTENDNFMETLDSYYEIFKFFRDAMKILDNEDTKKDAQEVYLTANEAIRVLNEFLTKNQSNYRRWYKYVEKENERKFYMMPIGDLQKEYMNYEQLCDGFKKVNSFFINRIAHTYNINIEKWGISTGRDSVMESFIIQ